MATGRGIITPASVSTAPGVILAGVATGRGIITPASVSTAPGVILASVGTAPGATVAAWVRITGRPVIVGGTLRTPGVVGTFRPPLTACGHPDGSAGRRPLLSQGAPPGMDLTVRNGRKQTCEQRSLVVRTPCGRTERNYAIG